MRNINTNYTTKCNSCKKRNASISKPLVTENCDILPDGVVTGVCFVKIFEARVKIEGDNIGLANALTILARFNINLQASQFNYERCKDSYYLQIVTDNFEKTQAILNQQLTPDSNLQIISIKDGLRITFAGGDRPGLLASVASVIDCKGYTILMATATPTPGQIVVDTDDNRSLYQLLKPKNWPNNRYCWLG